MESAPRRSIRVGVEAIKPLVVNYPERRELSETVESIRANCPYVTLEYLKIDETFVTDK